MTDEIDHHRRRFFGTAAMTIAAAQLGMIGSAAAQSGRARRGPSAGDQDRGRTRRSAR